jgi:hypothetical protein
LCEWAEAGRLRVFDAYDGSQYRLRILEMELAVLGDFLRLHNVTFLMDSCLAQKNYGLE